MTSACPPAGALSALLSGHLPTGSVDTLEAHLTRCDSCRRRLDELTTSPVLEAWVNDGSARANAYPYLSPPGRPGDLGRVGRYAVQAELGRGGMGVVFRAWDDELRRAVALKVARVGRDDGEAAERFTREARAAGKTRHDHLVPVLDVTHTEDGRPVIVMPLVAGPSLRDHVRAAGALAPREAAALVRGVADGLNAVHAASLIHRDVKPANVLLDREDGRAKLTDFGLSRDLAPGEALTRDGAILGTPEYLSPEQAADASRATPASDIYSLGVTLYECLTGVVPFRGSPFDVIAQHARAEPVPVRRLTTAVPIDLETVCLKCLEKDPARRYPSAAALADDLGRFLDGRPVSARPLGPLGRSRRWAHRNPLPVAVVLVSVAGAVAAGAGWWRAWVKAREADANASAATTRAGEAELAKGEARRQADLAGERARIALGAINTLVRKAQTVTDTAPGTLKLKKELTEAALADLRKLSANAAAVPGTDRATFHAHRRLGDAFDLLGQSEDAVREYERALGVAERMTKADPADHLARRDFATVHYNLGFIRNRLLDRAAARTHFTAAVETLEAVCRERRDDADAHQNLSVALNGRGDLARDAGDRAAARADAEQALAISEELSGRYPNNALYRNDVIYSHSRLGYVCVGSEHDYPAGIAHFRAALKAVAAGLAHTPNDPTLLRYRRVCLLDLCSGLQRQDDLAGAEAAALEALPLLEAGAAAEPENGLIQRDLAVGLWHLSWVRIGQGRLADAEALYERAGKIFDALAGRAKSSSLVAGELPTNWYYLGILRFIRGQYPEAADRFERAARETRRLLPGQGDKAAEFQELAEDIRRLPAALADPGVLKGMPPAAARRMAAYRVMALAWRGEPAAARTALNTLSSESPTDPLVLFAAALTLGRSARAAGDPAEREQLIRSGIDALCACGRAKKSFLGELYLYPETAPLRSHPTFAGRMRELPP